MKRYAVIPTGSRKEDYLSVIDWCKRHNVTTVTISTSDEADEYSVGKKIKCRELNISKWWNLGLEYIAEKEFETNEEYVVAVLNDDVVLPENWFEMLEPMIKKGSSGASGLRFGIKRQISGYAFLLNGRHDIRADEALVWYWGDDGIQKYCESEGGFALVTGLKVGNKYARSSEVFMSEQIEKDRAYYMEHYS